MSLSDQIAQLTSIKADSLLYQAQHANYNNFQGLCKYLQSADAIISHKIQAIDQKIQTVYDQFIRTSSVFEINNKKRQKQQDFLRIERQRIAKQLNSHEDKVKQFKINPMTLVLKTKHHQLRKLQETQIIIKEFQKLIEGNKDQLDKIMPLDDKNFSDSAKRIYVFKALLQDMDGPQYQNPKILVNKKYAQLKFKIGQNFKQGFWNKDNKAIRTILPYCQQYQLLEEISQFYNQQVLKTVHKLTKLNVQNETLSSHQLNQSIHLQDQFTINKLEEQEAENQIRNLFFEVEQGFNSVFRFKDELTGQINPQYIDNMMGKFTKFFARKLISYAFQKIIRQSLQNILKASTSIMPSNKRISICSSYYLCYLEIFYDYCKILLRKLQEIITDQRSIHLMSTHFQSIFDAYLDNYIHKQLNNLEQTFEKCTIQLMKNFKKNQMKDNSKLNNSLPSPQKRQGTTNTIKRIFNDFMIESKKDVFSNNPTASQSVNNALVNQEIKKKIQNLQKIFTSAALQNIFTTTKVALSRNSKIAKFNQMDKNRNQILQSFLSNIQQIIHNMINLISELVPPYSQKGLTLEPDFFIIIPNINVLLQRIQVIFQEFKKDNKYRLAESIKIEQRKQSLINQCGKAFNKVVGEALAVILTSQNSLLMEDAHQYYILNSTNQRQTFEACTKVITLLERYIKHIQKINLSNYRRLILKNLGIQFVNLLIDFYSSIPYTKNGLSKIFMDIAKYKTLISSFYSSQVENHFKLLRILIDIYVIKNEEKSIQQYLKNEGLVGITNKQLSGNKMNQMNISPTIDIEKVVRNYVENKQKFEKNIEGK